MKRKGKPIPKVVTIRVTEVQANRLTALARRWGVEPSEALRRALDQAFVGRGALVAIETGFIALEHFLREKPEKKAEEKKP